MTTGSYRKRPVVIQAMQWTGSNVDEMESFTNPGEIVKAYPSLRVVTIEGVMAADPTDWLIRGVEGELYPCKDSIFQATYTVDSGAPDQATEIITDAFTIIANAGNGDWSREGKEWEAAAIRWRERFHAYLAAVDGPIGEPEDELP